MIPETTPVLTTPERSVIASPIGWSTIFAGAVVAAGVWVVLHLFGIGVGLIGIDPDDPSSLRAAGIGTGVWSLIAPVIAMFVGGLVAGRVAPTINTMNAAIHGAVVWALTMLGSLLLITMIVGATVRGVATTTAAAASAAGQPLSRLDDVSPRAVGLDADDLIAPLNQRLRAEGMPRVTPEQVEAIARDVVESAVRNVGMDRETVVSITARHTALSRAEAERVADEVERELADLRARGCGIASRAGHEAMEAAEAIGMLVLVLSITMLVGLIAAIGGSILSVRRERREHVVLPRAAAR